MSARFTPAARTRMRISSGLIEGSGTSPSFSALSSPGFSTITAFIISHSRRAFADSGANFVEWSLPRQDALGPPGRARFGVRCDDRAILFRVLARGFAGVDHIERRIGGSVTLDECDDLANLGG